MAQDSTLEPGNNYGIPARTPASTSLWAHLLRKDTSARGQSPNKLGPVLPPITPLDKNGTSMRILLHDTQAHLDRFSERSDKLFSIIDETKREISIVNTLFQREHGTLTEELVDLDLRLCGCMRELILHGPVNRSQTQLQRSIGTPAQTEQLGRLSKEINAHLEAIDKRLDAIHFFNQTHSQVLQLQSQAIQSLQEQQGTMLTALIPLLPLLQAIPLHIESARNKITDILIKPAAPPITHTEPSDQNCDRSGVDVQRRGSKRSSSTLGSDSPPSPANRKKARLDITSRARENGLSRPIPVSSVVIEPKQREFGSSLRGSVPPASTSSSRLTRQETTIVPSPRSTPPVDHQISALKKVDHIGAPSSPSSLPSFIPSSSKRRPLITRADSVSFRTVELFGKGSSMVQTSDTTRPGPMRFPSNFATPSSDVTRPSVPALRAPTRRLWSTTQKSREKTPRQVPNLSTSPSSPQSDMRPTKHIKPNSLASHSKNRPSTILIGPTCHPGQHFPAGQRLNSRTPTRTALHGTSMIQPPNAPLRTHGQAFALPPDQSRKPLLPPVIASSPMFGKQAKIRERRSPRVGPCLVIVRLMTEDYHSRKKEGASFRWMIRTTTMGTSEMGRISV
ncbi:hypothetical protein C0995_002086 [Termitomyces sp. Mi166|nr:hypothetical protein C0995_002086 [Termitomyces sp. Mi166\